MRWGRSLGHGRAVDDTVLTVTLVAVQLAMGQFSPRIVRALFDDRGDQIAVAVFGATFSFALLSLRAVSTGPGATVPAVTIVTAMTLAIASDVSLFFFVNHAGHRLHVAGLVDLVGDKLRAELDARYPAPGRGGRRSLDHPGRPLRKRDPLR